MAKKALSPGLQRMLKQTPLERSIQWEKIVATLGKDERVRKPARKRLQKLQAKQRKITAKEALECQGLLVKIAKKATKKR